VYFSIDFVAAMPSPDDGRVARGWAWRSDSIIFEAASPRCGLVTVCALYVPRQSAREYVCGQGYMRILSAAVCSSESC
jgi:hypothetical protein